nr:hypothetical protein [Streptomyces sp. Alain-F2R5]
MSVARLKAARFGGYLRHAIPHELDSDIDAVITSYLSSPASVRQRAIDDLDRRSASVLSAYGQRMASAAVRAGSAETLRRGLVAVGMAEERLGDARENLYALAAINDGASLIGTSLQGLITTVSGFLPSTAVDRLRAFDQRQERDKALDSMGLSRCGGDQDFFYC